MYSLVDKTKFGLLPKLALARLTGSMSQSFNERLNSATKDVITPERNMLAEETWRALALCRVNRKAVTVLKRMVPEAYESMRDLETLDLEHDADADDEQG